MKTSTQIQAVSFSLLLASLAASCGGARSFLALDEKDERSKPIANPFGSMYPGPTYDSSAPVVVRSKKGDRAVEFEIPARDSEVSEWVVPVSPQGRGPASVGGSEASAATAGGSGSDYGSRRPSSVDREIQRQMPQTPAEEIAERRELEQEMGLAVVEEDLPKGDRSYLGSVDRIKSLFRERRYEAALLEVEELMKEHPTDPRLHAMRGTLLDRLGYGDLARQSWAQSLKLDPSNEPLRRFLDRRGERTPAAAVSTGGGSR